MTDCDFAGGKLSNDNIDTDDKMCLKKQCHFAKIIHFMQTKMNYSFLEFLGVPMGKMSMKTF